MTKGFEVHSPDGRVWLVPETAIIDDYVAFLMDADKVTEEEARVQAKQNCDPECWFNEQFDWRDVEKYGTLIKEPSKEKITVALNFYREWVGGGPGNDYKVIK